MRVAQQLGSGVAVCAQLAEQVDLAQVALGHPRMRTEGIEPPEAERRLDQGRERGRWGDHRGDLVEPVQVVALGQDHAAEAGGLGAERGRHRRGRSRPN